MKFIHIIYETILSYTFSNIFHFNIVKIYTKIYYICFNLNFMNNLSKLLLLCLSILLFNNVVASNQLKISTHILDFYASKQYLHFTIYNQEDSVVNIRTVAYNINKNNTISTKKSMDLISVPKKFKLKPGNSRKIKIIKRIHPKEIEQSYIIYVINGSEILQSSLIDKPINKTLYFDKHAEILAIIRPQFIHDSIQTKKSGQKLTVKNTGNTTIYLTEIKQCDDACVNYANLILSPQSEKAILLKKPGVSLDLVENILDNKKNIHLS